MSVDNKSIDQQIINGKNLKLSDKAMNYEGIVSLDSGVVVVLNTTSILSKYMDFIKTKTQVCNFSEKDALMYEYKPHSLSFDIYKTIELVPLILRINNMLSVMEFTNLDRGIKLFSVDIISYLNEIIIKEKNAIQANRTLIRKELNT